MRRLSGFFVMLSRNLIVGRPDHLGPVQFFGTIHRGRQVLQVPQQLREKYLHVLMVRLVFPSCWQQIYALRLVRSGL